MKISLTIITILILGSCGRQKGTTAESTQLPKSMDTIVRPSAAVDETIFPNLDCQTLLGKLYDDPEFDSNRTAIWKPNYHERMTIPVSYDGKCHTNIDTIMYFTDSRNKKCACVILTNYNYRRASRSDSCAIEIGDCHFCGVPIGVALLTKWENVGWKLYGFEKNITSFGYYGTYRTGRQDAGKIQLKEIGDKWTCLSLTQGIGGSTGGSSGYENLYSIEAFQLGGFQNSTLNEILSYNYDFGYRSPDGEVDTIAHTRMKILKRKGDYYDIDLVVTENGRTRIEHLEYSADSDGFVEK